MRTFTKTGYVRFRDHLLYGEPSLAGEKALVNVFQALADDGMRRAPSLPLLCRVTTRLAEPGAGWESAAVPASLHESTTRVMGHNPVRVAPHFVGT